jgi:hypothetical protein
MVYDNEAGAQYIYGGVDRLRANIAVSQAAYAEASKRTARDSSLAAARRRKSHRVEMSADERERESERPLIAVARGVSAG